MKMTILVSHTPFLAILLDSNPLIYHRVYRLYNHLCIPVVSYPGRCKYISITSCLHSACCARWYRQNAEMRCFLTIVRKAGSPARTTQPRCRKHCYKTRTDMGRWFPFSTGLPALSITCGNFMSPFTYIYIYYFYIHIYIYIH